MLFSPGPTEIEADIRDIAAKPLPYFRGTEYTDMILELMSNAQYLFQTEQTPLTLTASGSGVMEMAIVNLLNIGDRVVVLNCGTFGAKWTEMCKAFELEVDELKVEWGKTPDLDKLEALLTPATKALLVTAHETSTGLANDIQMLGQLARQRNVLLIVDAVSAIGADEFQMDEWNCDCAIVSSQKALACMPGISFIVFSERAWRQIPEVKRSRYYFDAQEYLKNASRGMLPYTPAINVTYQVHERLKRIRAMGLEAFIAQHAEKARAFRKILLQNPDFSQYSERPSNALSAIRLPDYVSMSQIITYIKQRYAWYLAPNPTQAQNYLRISHMGDISLENMLLMAQRIQEAATWYKQHPTPQVTL